MQSYEIIIVGAGPAGASTALQLAALDPNLAERVLLLDKATFPRFKLCAGGVTNRADKILAQLGVNIESQSEPVHTSKITIPTGTLTLKQESHFRVIQREIFDHQLFSAAQGRGIITREAEAIERLIINSDRVMIRTSKNEYSSKIIIGADGANSVVRRLLGLSRASRVMMAIELYAPMDRLLLPDFYRNMAVFDFTVSSKGIPGYCWIFPSVHESLSMVNVGIIDSSLNKVKGISLNSAFEHWLKGIISGWNYSDLRAHPALRYEPRTPCSQYRALLVGDAAGIDPLFGEGITSALALGMLAAQSAYDALGNRDFSFSNYEGHIRSSVIGSLMRRRRTVARRFYSKYPLVGRQLLQLDSLLDWVSPMSTRNVPSAITWQPSSSHSSLSTY
jgi:geranylgeranyl reductase family protein